MEEPLAPLVAQGQGGALGPSVRNAGQKALRLTNAQGKGTGEASGFSFAVTPKGCYRRSLWLLLCLG